MSKYKPLFLSEAGEHLNELEKELLALEKEPGASGPIHETFRHLHSLKSMAASMGYEPMNRLAHRLEDLVSPHREQGHALTARECDALLQGLDVLRGQLEAVVKEGQIPDPPQDYAAELRALIGRAGDSSEEASAAPAQQLALPEPFLRVRVRVDPDCSLPAVRALVVHKRLASLGAILACQPEEGELRTGSLPEGLMEFALDPSLEPQLIRKTLDGVPELAEIQIQAVAPASAPASPAAPLVSPQPEAGPARNLGDTVRVRTDLLDFVVDSIGELITLRSYFEELAEQLDQPALRDGVRRMNAVVRRLQDRIMDVRMVPASLMTQRLPRVCRDVAKRRGKQVDFLVEGEQVELDRALAEELDTPLLHLVRNAVDHGLESPEERERAGKDPEGHIQLSIRRQQDRILIELSDDGRGLDLDRIRERGRQKGWLDGGDRSPSEEEILDWIFRPGFSTAEAVSDTSGRGVGLDAVRATLERLNGRVSARSSIGQGTTFVLDLPLTLAILQVLLVELHGQILAIPASRVLRAMAMRLDALAEEDGTVFFETGGQRLPYADLEALLGAGQGEPSRRAEVVWLGRGEDAQLALGFDRLTGHREVVLKSIGPLLRSVGPFSGSTVLGDGRPVLILDVDAIMALEQRARRELKA